MRVYAIRRRKGPPLLPHREPPRNGEGRSLTRPRCSMTHSIVTLLDPFHDHSVLLITDFLARDCEEIVDPVTIEFGDLAPDHFQRAVQEMILLRESLPQNGDRRGKPSLGELSLIDAPFFGTVQFRIQGVSTPYPVLPLYESSDCGT